MGINVSRTVDLTENEYLRKFVGTEHIPSDDQNFWELILQFHIGIPSNSQEQLSLDIRLETLCQTLLSNNLKTGNFRSLITVFLNKTNELLSLSDQESSLHIWKTFNALFMIRTVVKYMLETGPEFRFLQHFEAMPYIDVSKSEANDNNINEIISFEAESSNTDSPDVILDGSKLESFFNAIVNLIVIIPVKEFTYHLHLEAVNTIVTLLSVHLSSQDSTNKSQIFKIIYNCENANVLMSSLLHYVSKMIQIPNSMFGISTGGSFVFDIAESLLSMLTFRKNQDVLNTGITELPQQFKEYFPLANQSLLLILILTNHYTTKDNSYRTSLFTCSDSKETTQNGSSFKIDFNALYNTLCRIITIDQSTLLLYLLLHRNQNFNKFIMSQENLQQLVVPILQTLYNAPDSTSHHIYMSLIVLLILSEDDGFNKSVHLIMLKNIAWYAERPISEISLGGLLILVVIRTIQYNMLKMRDKYLHTNCLAALANMSGQFRSLHPYVAQRLISLFETLAKKHTRLDTQLKKPINGTVNIDITQSNEDMIQDLAVLEEVLRMVLEILNSCLSNQLIYCPNLVYTLLYKRHVFESFRGHHTFQDVLQNIDMVVGFFSSRLQRVQEQRGELSVQEVLEVISKGASQWSSDRLRKFPDLKFKYVEEEAPEEFFIPYVWTLVCKFGCVHFNSESIKTITTDINC